MITLNSLSRSVDRVIRLFSEEDETEHKETMTPSPENPVEQVLTSPDIAGVISKYCGTDSIQNMSKVSRRLRDGTFSNGRLISEICSVFDSWIVTRELGGIPGCKVEANPFRRPDQLITDDWIRCRGWTRITKEVGFFCWCIVVYVGDEMYVGYAFMDSEVCRVTINVPRRACEIEFILSSRVCVDGKKIPYEMVLKCVQSIQSEATSTSYFQIKTFDIQ